MKLYVFRKVPLSIIRSYSLQTQQQYMSYRFAGSFGTGSGWNSFRPDPDRKLSANLYDIYHCCVYSAKLLMMDRGTFRNMQNFIPKNIFEKLVHLVGFVIRIYHDARSHEPHISTVMITGQISRTHKGTALNCCGSVFLFQKLVIYYTKLTKCTNLFLLYLHYNIALNILPCFHPWRSKHGRMFNANCNADR